MEREPLTEDEQGLIATAIRHPGFPCQPQYLADCHRLFERGWLDRKLIGGQLTWSLSARGAHALELGIPLADAKAAMN